MRVGLRGEIDAMSERAGGLRSAFDALDQAVGRFTSSAQSGLRGLRDAFDDLDEAGDGLVEQFEQLKEFATMSGLDMSSVLTAAAHLRVLKLESRDTIPFLKEIAGVLARSGRGSQELERAARALGEISSKTRLYSEEINQLGNAGVPVWEMLAQATGRSKEELTALVKQGRISATAFIQAFRAFARDGSDELWITRDVSRMAAAGRQLESELATMKDRLFELSEGGLDGLSNLEALDHRLDVLLRSGQLKAAQMQQFAGTISDLRKAAAELDKAEDSAHRERVFLVLRNELTGLNRSMAREITDLEVYAGRAKAPLDELFESFENLRGIQLAPGAFLPLLKLLDQLKISSAEDVAAQSREIGAALLGIVQPAMANDLNPEQLGTLVPSMVEGIRRAYELAERQLTPVQVELNRLENQRRELQSEIAVAAATAAERYRNVWLAATNDIALGDVRARESMIENSVVLADKNVYHAERADARVFDYLAAQKGITEIAADAKIGLLQKSFDGIEEVLDRIVPKLYGFGGLIKQVVADLLKLELSNLFRKLFAGAPGTGTWGQGPISVGAGGGLSGLFGGIAGGIKRLFGMGSQGIAGSQGAAGVLPSLLSGGAPVMMTDALANTMGIDPLGMAGTAGTAASGLNMASVGAFLTNPFTLAAAGAITAGVLLFKHFSHRTEKDLKSAIEREYGIQVREMSVLSQVKQIGEQAFGLGQVRQHLLETIRLDQSKELLGQYAASTGQTSAKLVSDAQYRDPSFSENRFIRRIAGGLVPGTTQGFDHVPLLSDGGEYVLRSSVVAGVGVTALDALNSGRATIVQHESTPGRGGVEVTSTAMAALVGALERSNSVIEKLEAKLKAARPGDVFRAAIDEDPHLGGRAVERSADVSSGHLVSTLRKLGFA